MTRVSAPDIEAAVIAALRNESETRDREKQPAPKTDRELIEKNVDRIIVKPQGLDELSEAMAEEIAL